MDKKTAVKLKEGDIIENKGGKKARVLEKAVTHPTNPDWFCLYVDINGQESVIDHKNGTNWNNKFEEIEIEKWIKKLLDGGYSMADNLKYLATHFYKENGTVEDYDSKFLKKFQ